MVEESKLPIYIQNQNTLQLLNRSRDLPHTLYITPALLDKNQDVADVWHYLLAASKNDILSLPDVSVGDDIRNITTLSSAERKLIGFHINPGSTAPRNFVMKASRWAAGKKYCK